MTLVQVGTGFDSESKLLIDCVGTSSKSTKLVHGGVRYLQKAVFELDYEQYKLVREALHERRVFLHTAPYLSKPLPIMLPLYKYVSFTIFCILTDSGVGIGKSRTTMPAARCTISSLAPRTWSPPT